MNIERLKDILLSKCPKVKKNLRYLNRYQNYIFSCLKHNTTEKPEYTEVHHICPTSLFPEYENLLLNPWNSAILSGKQHYRAHYLLAKIYGGSMWSSINLMRRLVDERDSNSKSYNLRFEEIRKNISSIASKRFKEHWKDPIRREKHIQSMNQSWTEERRISHSILMQESWTQERKDKQSKDFQGQGNPFFNKTHSEETKVKIKDARALQTFSDETKKRISEACTGELNGFYGKTHSEETITKLKESLAKLEPIICPHCQKTSKSRANMKRYHFDNCKFRNT